MTHNLPELEYEYNALEPYFDEETMRIHHTKHHQAYINKLNAALEGDEALLELTPEQLLEDLDSVPERIREAVRNHGGGHFNHSFWWPLLKKNVAFSGEVANEIKKTFGSFENFKERFKNAALARFGSGWTWLALNNGKLEIISTPNQDCPLTEGKLPVLGLDLWEHSYYLRYRQDRAAYIDAFFNIINWEKVNENFTNASI